MSAPKDPKKYALWKLRLGEEHKGQIPWNKNLTKETDERVRQYAETLGITQRERFKDKTKHPRFGAKLTTKTKNKIGKSRTGKHYPKAQEAAKKRIGPKASRWKGGPVSVNCSACGEELLRPRGRIKEGRNFFCNPKCMGKWRSKNRTGKNNPAYGKLLPQERKDKIRRTLQGQMVGEKNPAYIDGRSFEPYLAEFSDELKELIRLRDGYKCQKCGCPEIENGEKLSVHHIDYDKKNCLPSNLISLCRRCNAEVNKDRKHWILFFAKILAKPRQETQLSFRASKSVKNKTPSLSEIK